MQEREDPNLKQPVLRMQNITKRFPGVLALKDVSLDLYANEIVSIVGENGAGKSTLMKILSGSYPFGSYEGTIEICGKASELHSAHDAEKSGIAMIYQELNVELDLSVAENIILGRWPRKSSGLIDWKKANKMAQGALDLLNAELDVKAQMRNLNASMQQLVCIARALVQNPSILILDEPTSALTQGETENLMRILRQLKQNGLSCIYISHKLDEVFDLSDRVIAMRDGCVVSEYAREAIEPTQIIEDMIGRKVDHFYPKSTKHIGEEVLRVENIAVRHPYAYNKNIIEDVSFSVHKGEILGLAGLVGSGRSELLRAIYGALPRVNGKVFIEGKPCNITQPSEAIKNGMCFLSEDRKHDGFISTMSIRQNMTISILKKISKKSFIRKRVENTLTQHYFDFLAIKAPHADTNILALSGGNQQKVILSKALLTDMKVLFLDEPTRGVDIGAKAEIYKIINELTSKGLSVVMISSELPELVSVCDRFIVLGKGTVCAEYSKEDVSESALLHAACFSTNTGTREVNA